MSAIHTPCTADVCHPAVISKSSKKRWIPADLVQNTAEYLGSVASLVSFRGVSSMWQVAVSDAVGFLNGRCWTQLRERLDNPQWKSLSLDHHMAVARCALLCLGHGPTLEGELNLASCVEITDVSRLQSCRALKQLDLSFSDLRDAGIRGLELIPTLEVLNLVGCRRTTNVSFLQRCCALKKLDLSSSNVTDRGIHGLELIPTLEELDLSRCLKLHDLSALRNRPGLQIVGPENIMLPF
jgi:hypothetical protein